MWSIDKAPHCHEQKRRKRQDKEVVYRLRLTLAWTFTHPQLTVGKWDPSGWVGVGTALAAQAVFSWFPLRISFPGFFDFESNRVSSVVYCNFCCFSNFLTLLTLRSEPKPASELCFQDNTDCLVRGHRDAQNKILNVVGFKIRCWLFLVELVLDGFWSSILGPVLGSFRTFFESKYQFCFGPRVQFWGLAGTNSNLCF